VGHYVPRGRPAGRAASSGNASLIATFLVIFYIRRVYDVRLSCARLIFAYLIIIIVYYIVKHDILQLACQLTDNATDLNTSRFLQLLYTECRIAEI